MSQHRQADYAVDPVFLHRWSPRGFKPVAIAPQTLFSFFEAARWAPSAINAQPWRFIYALNGSAHWDDFLDLLSEYNRSWASRSSALVLIISKTVFLPPDKDTAVPIVSHSFDTGAAWANFALQAHISGWVTHAIGGYDRIQARQVFSIPDDYHLEAIIAVGQQGDASHLSEALQAREQPTPRRPIQDFVAEGTFDFLDV